MNTLNRYWIYNAEYQLMPRSVVESIFKDNYAYEVIRLLNGKPLFLKEHFDRLLNTCAKSYGEIPSDFELLKDEIAVLVEKECLQDVNIKIVVKGGMRAVFAIESQYPTDLEYRKGISCVLLFTERKNPELKIFQAGFREKADRIKHQEHIFESILVNQNGDITEGSKSNIFFIKGHSLYTAPHDMVLSGVTRQKIIEIARSKGIEMVYKAVNYKEISDFEAAFISGTSPGVIAIRYIQSQSFKVDNSILKMIQERYFEKQV